MCPHRYLYAVVYFVPRCLFHVGKLHICSVVALGWTFHGNYRRQNHSANDSFYDLMNIPQFARIRHAKLQFTNPCELNVWPEVACRLNFVIIIFNCYERQAVKQIVTVLFLFPPSQFVPLFKSTFRLYSNRISEYNNIISQKNIHWHVIIQWRSRDQGLDLVVPRSARTNKCLGIEYYVLVLSLVLVLNVGVLTVVWLVMLKTFIVEMILS